jgi:hypothetical protein
MTKDNVIDYSQFSAARIQKAVEAIKNRPKLTRYGVVKLEHKRDTLMARFDEVSTIMQPLEESYVSVRRKMDRNYDPDHDRRLQEVNKASGERRRALLAEIEPLHDMWKKVVAAREAEAYLMLVLEQCLKLCDFINLPIKAERGEDAL